MADSCSFILRNANIYNTREQKFVRGSMAVDKGVITGLYVSEGADADCPGAVCECGGYFVIPGMVDVHTHGRAGFDFAYASGDEIRKMCASYAEAGTTTVFATIATAPFDTMKRAVANAALANAAGMASVSGVHIEGRYISAARRGAHNPEMLAPPDIGELNELIDLAGRLKFHITAAPELDGGEAFIKAAVKRGATVGIGHSDASYEQASEALTWGATSFTHTYNAMRPLHHREPGTVGAALVSGAYAELICDGFHLHPGAVKLAYLSKPHDRTVLVTDSMAGTGAGDGTYLIAGQQVEVKDGKAVKDGVISGSALNLLDGMFNYARFCGITLEEAIPSATINPARMVGISDTAGTLEIGKRADFCVLAPDRRTLAGVCCAGIPSGIRDIFRSLNK